MKDTTRIGLITELKLQEFLLEKSYNIYVPIGIHRYDLLLEINKIFYKIQVKTAKRINNNITFSNYSLQFSEGGKRNKKRRYTKEDIDLIVGYYDNEFYCLPVESVITNTITLRLSPGLVKFKKHKWAKDYKLLDMLKKLDPTLKEILDR
jgi:hypothetical protein